MASDCETGMTDEERADERDKGKEVEAIMDILEIVLRLPEPSRIPVVEAIKNGLAETPNAP